MKITLDRHIYHHPAHGPQIWPWWLLIVVRIVRCTHDPYWYFWITPISYNVWIYSRWGARTFTVRERAGVYRRADEDDDGWTGQTS